MKMEEGKEEKEETKEKENREEGKRVVGYVD